MSWNRKIRFFTLSMITLIAQLPVTVSRAQSSRPRPKANLYVDAPVCPAVASQPKSEPASKKSQSAESPKSFEQVWQDRWGRIKGYLIPDSKGVIRVKSQWSCPSTRVGALPEKIAVQISVNMANGDFDISSFRSLIEQAKKKPELDYYNCFESLVEDSLAQVSDGLTFGGRIGALVEGDGFINGSRYGKLSNALNLLLSDYEDILQLSRSETPFSPAELWVPPISSNERSKMYQALRENCGRDMDSSFLDGSFLEGLPAETASLSSSCRRRVSREFAKLLLSAEPRPRNCPVNQPCPRQAQIQKALALLSHARLTPYLRENPVFDDNCSHCQTELEDTMSRFASTVKSQMECTVPKPGESIVVSDDPGTGMIFDPTGYTLTRLPDRLNNSGKRVPAYQATLRLNFVYPELANHVRKAMMDKVRRCYREASPKMLGPRGESLELKLFDDNPDVPTPPVHNIAVLDLKRDAFFAWKSEIQCSTLVHESMHLMGLVDEYPETVMGARVSSKGERQFTKTTQFDCRVASPQYSLMYDEINAYRATSDSWNVTYCRCNNPCNPAGKQCESELVSLVRASAPRCPANSGTFYKNDVKSVDNEGFAAGNRIEGGGVILSLRKSANSARPSLLMPAQFHALVSPGCESNNVFYTCSQEAYKTSTRFYGKDRCEVNLPRQCKYGRMEWLNQ